MDEVSKSWMLKAQKYCLERDFDLALEQFDNVIQRTKPGRRAPIEALDRRAAVFVQLQRFSEAFQDGKRMIRDYKTDPRGYLRTAVVLKYQAAEKRDDTYLQSALKVARSGKQNADKTNAALYKTLERLYDELILLSKSTGLDPAAKLPVELFAKVLEQLTRKDVLSARRISKHWNALITGTKRLWRSMIVDFVAARDPRRLTRSIDLVVRLATDLNRTCHLTELEFKHRGAQNRVEEDRVLISILMRAARLQILRLQGRPWPFQNDTSGIQWAKVPLLELKSLEVAFKMGLDSDAERAGMNGVLSWIHQILSALPNLEHLVVDGDYWRFDPTSAVPIDWPPALKLRSLHIGQASLSSQFYLPVQLLNLPKLAKAAPSLNDLRLSMESSFKRFPEAEPDNTAASALDLGLFPRLTQLTWAWDGAWILPAAKSLKSLSLDACSFHHLIPQTSSLPELLSESDGSLTPSLKYLRCFNLSALDFWAPYLQRLGCKLQTLHIDMRRRQSHDFSIPEFLRMMHTVQILDELTDLTITGLTMHSDVDNNLASWFATNLPNLRSIILEGETPLNGAGMHKLATRLPNLSLLDVGKAPLANVDVIAFFRSRGIELRGAIGQQNRLEGRGKKLRYG